MNFSHAFPDFYKTYLEAMERLQQQYLKVGRLCHYLGSGQLLAFSNFGHKYKIHYRDLEALKPLFKPSASDMAISLLGMHLHTPGSLYAYVCPGSSYHLLNQASLQSESQVIFVLESDQEALIQTLNNGYLNDLHTRLIPHHVTTYRRLKRSPAVIEAPLETATRSAAQPWDVDRELFGRICPLEAEATLESLLDEDQLLQLRAVIFDQWDRLPLPQRDLSDLTLLNPSCYFLVHIDPSHSDQYATFVQQWQALDYQLWRLPDLKALDGPASLYPYWALIAHENCFNA